MFWAATVCAIDKPVEKGSLHTNTHYDKKCDAQVSRVLILDVLNWSLGLQAYAGIA